RAPRLGRVEGEAGAQEPLGCVHRARATRAPERGPRQAPGMGRPRLQAHRRARGRDSRRAHGREPTETQGCERRIPKTEAVMEGITLDSGALIAAERRHARIWTVLRYARKANVPRTIPSAVIAEWWRGRTDIREQILDAADVEPLDDVL